MINMLFSRVKRTVGAVVFHVAPVWHLTNLRREAYDQIEDLHYQVGYSRANRLQIEERLVEIRLELDRDTITMEERAMLETEQRQLGQRLEEANRMEAMAQEVVATYQESLPNLVGQLDQAIQMTRLNRSQQRVIKALGSNQVNDGSDIREHITKVRASAYALSEQLSGHLVMGRLRRQRLTHTP